jgi:acyl-CoA hydrolase
MPEMVGTEATRVEMTQIVLPENTNNHGTIFGGQLVAWMDICGAVASQRFARGSVVTAAIDQLHFVAPVRQGMIVVLKGQINQAWGSSMEAGVRVEAEDPMTGERVHACSGFLTFVALDAHGKPCQVPELEVMEGEERRATDADARRAQRLAGRTRE